MAIVISVINMKGGVGKTTVAAQLLHFMSSLGHSTLAVDLDPQANLSQALLGQQRYLDHLSQNRPTIDDVVRGYLPPTKRKSSPTRCDFRQSIVERVDGYSSMLHLVPSRLELASAMKRSSIGPERLASAIGEVADAYEFIIIDCAPTESVLTECAYFASRWLLVPVKPEYLATIGLPLLAKSMQEFKSMNRRHPLKMSGIVINHATYGSQRDRGVEQSIAEIRSEAKRHDWRVFQHEIPYSRSWPKAARLGTPIHRTKSARRNVVTRTHQFASEFLQTLRTMG